MAPNQRIVPSGSRPQKGFVSTIYDEATNPENKTIVRSLLVFGSSSSLLCKIFTPSTNSVIRLGLLFSICGSISASVKEHTMYRHLSFGGFSIG
ncbi:uncharacterized protein N7515_009045 [Penicillium bovifimosum]|uniref:Uncharacterized protein n=1 Tax=Penicillium bovifimosum TaxID=126998 RepID=A0A9W9GIT7_9EURO|nr:uncharacterized protein N7515_009045 [Penicillium bovifimosum]KAJ5121084.1 hypothetical protein N7515_009045 [Penicillium bovifimosum]